MSVPMNPGTVVDAAARDRAARRLSSLGLRLPTLRELSRPDTAAAALADVDPDAPDARNLSRVHWFNAADRRGRVDVPGHVLLDRSFTGVDAPVIVALGDRFPMIGAHKVLAAYGCLAPRLVTGTFDPETHRAVWPSTGNYCRGGVAISRILGCRGAAVLPEGMSAERFEWLERWVAEPSDVIRTPGTESNVKEIYDKCAELEADRKNVILNQFAEYGNHLVHYACTGPALERIFETYASHHSGARPYAFVAASGSAGTLGAGSYLSDQVGARVVVAEALECPTLLYNGYGAHNIQGIGDKHVPLIHDVTGTDVVVALSDRASDSVHALVQTDAGRAYLADRRGVAAHRIAAFAHFGLSGLANVLSCIKIARAFELGPDDVLLTVATDGAAMYQSELDRILARDWPSGFDAVSAAEVYGEHVLGQRGDHVRELDRVERDRIFNLGYYTWVEQQGVSQADFDARRGRAFWDELHRTIDAWDEAIVDMNARIAAS